MATRCIWPPDIWFGRLWSWSPRPTFSLSLIHILDAIAGRFSPEELDAAERVMRALVQTVEAEKGD